MLVLLLVTVTIMPRNSSISTPSLTFGMWHIEGLNHDKINDPYCCNVISNLHVISLVETWSDGSQDFSIPDFDLMHSTSRKRGLILAEYLFMSNTHLRRELKH